MEDVLHLLEENASTPNESMIEAPEEHITPEESEEPKKSNLLNPMVPYIISLYLQLLINFIVLSLILFFGYKFISNIKADMRQREETYIAETIYEISICTQEYFKNKCAERPVPAIQKACNELFKCMNQDPNAIVKTKITAETIANIINSFIKPISWKSIFFINLLLFGSLIVSNVVLGGYRYEKNELERVKKQLLEKDQDIERLREKVQRLEKKEILYRSEKRIGNTYYEQDSVTRNRIGNTTGQVDF